MLQTHLWQSMSSHQEGKNSSGGVVVSQAKHFSHRCFLFAVRQEDICRNCRDRPCTRSPHNYWIFIHANQQWVKRLCNQCGNLPPVIHHPCLYFPSHPPAEQNLLGCSHPEVVIHGPQVRQRSSEVRWCQSGSHTERNCRHANEFAITSLQA